MNFKLFVRERRVVKHSDAELTLLNHINVMYKSSIVASSYFSIVKYHSIATFYSNGNAQY